MGLRGLLKTPGAHIKSSMTVSEACVMMSKEKLGAIVVVDNGEPCGIFTYRDLIDRVLLEKRDPEATSLAEVMTRDVESLTTDSSFGDALRIMVDGDYTYLPAVDERGNFLGTLSLRDILEHKIDHLASQLDAVTQYLAVDGPGGD